MHQFRNPYDEDFKFYQRYGYSTLASLHDYYEDGMTALKMVKMLAGTS
jgi:ribosomal protein S18 acetylase RimI-like enzyme